VFSTHVETKHQISNKAQRW